MYQDKISALAKAKGFNECYLLPALPDGEEIVGKKTICLMIKAYQPFLFSKKENKGELDAYYLTAQKSYLLAKEMAEDLKVDGVEAEHTTSLLIKPLLSALEDFVQLKNTLHVHREFGSYFHVQTLIIAGNFHSSASISFSQEKADTKSEILCLNCSLCEKACPSQAIDKRGYSREKCLRNYMFTGKIVPENMRNKMNMKFLGCDICQRVCPYNKTVMRDRLIAEGEIDITAVLTFDKIYIEKLQQKMGKNMAIPNRLCAQGCILAANSEDKQYLPLLTKLTSHPSPVIQNHALWAIEQLSTEA